MAIDTPSSGILVFCCDICFETLEMTADEGLPVADRVACLRLAKEAGWKSEKHVGYAWQHFCPDCGDAAAEEAKHRREAEQERERIKQRNALR
jgi:hypothetical protein